jgi:hypothetical protein
MKKFTLLFALLLIYSGITAQETETPTVTATKLKKADRYVLDITHDIWQETPAGIEMGTFQHGFGFTSFQDYPIGTSNFAFAWGVGISVHNMHSNGILTHDTAGLSEFIPIPEKVTFGSNTMDITYKVNKLTLTYLETPVELRFRTKGSNTFRVYAGFKLGLLLQEHTKYSGDDFITGSDNPIKYKEYKHRNFENLRYGPTFRIGYKWINFYGSYTMTSLFKKDKGPQMYPITVGIMISPF